MPPMKAMKVNYFQSGSAHTKQILYIAIFLQYGFNQVNFMNIILPLQHYFTDLVDLTTSPLIFPSYSPPGFSPEWSYPQTCISSPYVI